jgi:hypothetical protein
MKDGAFLINSLTNPFYKGIRSETFVYFYATSHNTDSLRSTYFVNAIVLVLNFR